MLNFPSPNRQQAQDPAVIEVDGSGDQASLDIKHKEKIPVFSQLKVLALSWSNLLLVFVPGTMKSPHIMVVKAIHRRIPNQAGLIVDYTHQSPVTIFAIHFVAILPTILLLSFATEELDLRWGNPLGKLISLTFR